MRGYTGLAEAYREKGDPDRAMETLKAGAEQAGPREFELQFQMAATHLMRGVRAMPTRFYSRSNRKSRSFLAGAKRTV